MREPMLTIQIPLSSWNGIVNAIEKWTGRGWEDDVQILSDWEIMDPPEYRDSAAKAIAKYRRDVASESGT
jgi:hypothetical protein